MLNLELLDYWRASTRIQIDPLGFVDQLTRGGPIASNPSSFDARLNLNSDGRRSNVLRGSYEFNNDRSRARGRSADIGITGRFRQTLQVSIGPSYSRSHSTAQ